MGYPRGRGEKKFRNIKDSFLKMNETNVEIAKSQRTGMKPKILIGQIELSL